MRNPYLAALVGAIAGVVAEAMMWGLMSPPGSGVGFFIIAAVFYGPGNLLLAIPYAHALQDQVDREYSLGRVLAVGALCGIPLSVVNHAAVGLILYLRYPSFGTGLFTFAGFLPCAAGGVALGLACAGWVSLLGEETP